MQNILHWIYLQILEEILEFLQKLLGAHFLEYSTYLSLQLNFSLPREIEKWKQLLSFKSISEC